VFLPKKLEHVTASHSLLLDITSGLTRGAINVVKYRPDTRIDFERVTEYAFEQ